MNRYPWFPHEHRSRNDDFIHRAEDRFGHFGYSAWFKILEVLHEHGTGDSVTLTAARWAKELRSSQSRFLLYLEFCQAAGKLEFAPSQPVVRLESASGQPLVSLQPDSPPTRVEPEVRVTIKKVRKKWANLKSKVLSTSLQSPSKVSLDKEGEGDKETTTKRASKPGPHKNVPKDPKKPKPLTPIQRLMMAYKVCLKIDPDNKAWDQAQFKKWSRAAQKLLEAFPDVFTAIDWLGAFAERMAKSDLSWNLATAASHAWDEKGRRDAETGAQGNGSRARKAPQAGGKEREHLHRQMDAVKDVPKGRRRADPPY